MTAGVRTFDVIRTILILLLILRASLVMSSNAIIPQNVWLNPNITYRAFSTSPNVVPIVPVFGLVGERIIYK